MAQVQDNRPVTILVLGIVGLAMCGVVGGVAWFMGHQYELECKERGVEPDQMAIIGKYLGMVGVILLSIGLVMMALMVLLQIVVYVVVVVFYVVMVLVMVVAGAAAA